MSEIRQLWFPGAAGRLEGALRVARSPVACAVVAHPHPLHGGTLHHPVVFHSDRELHRAGLTTLRFNFRGVEHSEGRHDEGAGEVQDVAAAVAWLRGLGPALPMLLVGFSFGAWCSIRHAVNDDTVTGLIALGLPVRRNSFDEVERLHRPLAVVQGSLDEFGSPDEVERVIERGRPRGELHVLDGCTHVFPGRAREAAGRVVDAGLRMLPGG